MGKTEAGNDWELTGTENLPGRGPPDRKSGFARSVLSLLGQSQQVLNAEPSWGSRICWGESLQIFGKFRICKWMAKNRDRIQNLGVQILLNDLAEKLYFALYRVATAIGLGPVRNWAVVIGASIPYSPVAQLVERAAVNRFVVGSSPTGGAFQDRGRREPFRRPFLLR